MVMYDRAVATGLGPDQAKAWLLAHNRNDVSATRAIRQWMTQHSAAIPAVESLDASTIV
jgi:predicted RecB family nuclease